MTKTDQITLNAAVVTEGKQIASTIGKADRSFLKGIQDGTSIDVKLGKFLMELNKLADQHGLKGKAKSALLQQAGVARIDKRRRSEAFQLASNLEEIRNWVKSTKWKGGSLVRLLADWKKATQPKAEKKESSEAGEDKSSEAGNDKSSEAGLADVAEHSLTGEELAMLVLKFAKNREAVSDLVSHLTAAMATKVAA
jgi:hypothetical protein